MAKKSNIPVAVEIPYTPPFIVKKISFNDKEIFVTRVLLKPCGPFFTKWLRKNYEYWYSAWEVPDPNTKYQQYTQINNFIVALMGSQYLREDESESIWRKAFIEEGHLAIYQAAEKAVDGTRIGPYIKVVSETEFIKQPKIEVQDVQKKLECTPDEEAKGSLGEAIPEASTLPGATVADCPIEECSPSGAGEALPSSSGDNEAAKPDCSS